MFNKPSVMDKNPLKPTVIIFGKTLRISKPTQKAATFMAVTSTKNSIHLLIGGVISWNWFYRIFHFFPEK